MPPTNDTGNVLVVGPDVNGDHFEVQPGDDYTLPEPSRTVSDEESEAGGEETADEDPEEALGTEETPPEEVPPGEVPGEIPPPEGTDTEGTAE